MGIKTTRNYAWSSLVCWTIELQARDNEAPATGRWSDADAYLQPLCFTDTTIRLRLMCAIRVMFSHKEGPCLILTVQLKDYF